MEKQVNAHAAAVDAKKDEAFKAKKAEQAKAFAERQKQKKEDLIKFAKELADKGILDKLSPEAKKFFTEAANPTRSGSSAKSEIFSKMFGDNPKVGDSINLMNVFQKTFKSKAEIDRYVKTWAEKGTVVEFKAAANMLESTYTIKSLAK